MVAFTVTARNQLGDVVALSVVAFAWPSIAYVAEAVRCALALALTGYGEADA